MQPAYAPSGAWQKVKIPIYYILSIFT
jgi:hypothetical protein